MRDLWNTLITVAFGLGVIVVVLLLFYGFVSLLPGRWAERGKIIAKAAGVLDEAKRD